MQLLPDGIFKCACGREVPMDMTANIASLTDEQRRLWGLALHRNGRCCDACYVKPTRSGLAHPADFHAALGRTRAQVRELVAKAKARGHIDPDAPDEGPLRVRARDQ